MIQRRYLQLKLSRDLKVCDGMPHVQWYIEGLKLWLKSEPKRAKRKGGVGR